MEVNSSWIRLVIDSEFGGNAYTLTQRLRMAHEKASTHLGRAGLSLAANYLAAANRLATSSQLTTLQKAEM